MTVCTCRKK